MTRTVATSSTLHPAGRRSRLRRAFGQGAFIAIGIAAAVGGYQYFWRVQLKRFQVVAPGILYRSAQPTEFGMRYLADRHGIHTVVNLQMSDFRIGNGWLDFGSADGERESTFVRRLGLAYRQWPMGDEQSWPWPDAWELEEFFRLIDDPAERPVLIHCQGGRHRTGTFGALYRLEYDRWSAEAALEEMHSFGFGYRVPPQEHNLRAYVPRPLPTEAECRDLAAEFDASDLRPATLSVVELASRIHGSSDGRSREILRELLHEGAPFAIELASYAVHEPTDELAPWAVAAALRVLETPPDDERSIVAAAAIIADFGDRDAQQFLLAAIESGVESGEASRFYDALVRGVTNRYTPNRIAYLRPLLNDRRSRIGDAVVRYRYDESAAIHLAAITDELPILSLPVEVLAEEGPRLARHWFEHHADRAVVGPLRPPHGTRVAAAVAGPAEEVPSLLRR